jgi:hypothetical protein
VIPFAGRCIDSLLFFGTGLLFSNDHVLGYWNLALELPFFIG